MKNKQTHQAEVVYVSGDKHMFSPLTERQAKHIYDDAIRNMAINGVKRVSFGIIQSR